MKIIFDTATGGDNITSLEASSAYVDFPVSNLMNDYPTDVWKAMLSTATIRVNISKGSSLLLLNTNATGIAYTISKGSTYSYATGWSSTGWSLEGETITSGTDTTDGTAGRCWIDFTTSTVPLSILLTLTAASEVTAGIVRSGYTSTFVDPAYGMTEGSIDYSVEMELNNGTEYFRKRNVVRTFSNIKISETRANAWILKHDIFDAVGPKPLAIKLVTNAAITDDQFALFAKRATPPEIEHMTQTYSIINLELKEVV